MELKRAIGCPVTIMYTITDEKVRTSYKNICELYAGKPILGVEIGCYEGLNSLVMLVLNKDLKLVTIDNYDNMDVYTGGPRQEKQFSDLIKDLAINNLSRFRDRIDIVLKSSEEAVKDYPDNNFDYVYVDGEHTYEATKRDMKLWYPKVKVGGILGGHDVGMTEVSTALNEFIKENNITNWGKDPEGNGRSDFWIYK
jgi:hypothetical protein